MTNHVVIASAGNVLPAALASLRALGYSVTTANNGRLIKATSSGATFVAEDVLLLLGLVKLHELRGNSWQPSEAEIESYLSFDATALDPAANERADVWEERGAVHMICVTSYGDPVELNETEAQEFASRLAKAITEASS